MDPFNLTMARGEPAAFDLAVTRPTPAGPTAPVPLDGCRLRLTARRRIADPDAAAVFVKSTEDGSVVVTDAATGRARAHLAPADTADLGPGVVLLFVDARLTEPGGQPDAVVAMGQLTVGAEATRA